MSCIVDTPVWSLALRRPSGKLSAREREIVGSLQELVRDGQVLMPGVIRQEILSGIAQPREFERIRRLLGDFPDVPVKIDDHERAAEMFNACRARGIQGSLVDYLICALSEHHAAAIFSTDKDFKHYAEVLHLRSYGSLQR